MPLCYLHPYCHNNATRGMFDILTNKPVQVCNFHFQYPPTALRYGVATGSNMPFHSRHREAKTARLIYEPALQGYSLKFSYDKSILEFVKKVIPSHKRTTSGPPDWIWYFGCEYFDIIKTLFDSHPDFKVTYVTQAEVEEMQRKREESYHVVQPREFSIESELLRFSNLLVTSGATQPEANQQSLVDKVKNWCRDEAIKNYRRAALRLHPDKGGDPSKMAELNNTWALLKEGYYIK